MKQMFALFAASIVAGACGNGGPLAPTVPASLTAGVFTVSGAVADADGGKPLMGARVLFSSETGGRLPRRLALSDAGGLYSIQGLPSGVWSVTVSKSGYESESIDADVNTDVTLAFELHRGRSAFP